MRELVLWELVLLEDAASRDVLRVVQYINVGTVKAKDKTLIYLPPVLEKRHQYRHGGGEAWRNGKVRGLTGLDFAMAVQHMEEFEAALLSPWKSGRAGKSGADESAPAES